jgi:hypothetical protein
MKIKFSNIGNLFVERTLNGQKIYVLDSGPTNSNSRTKLLMSLTPEQREQIHNSTSLDASLLNPFQMSASELIARVPRTVKKRIIKLMFPPMDMQFVDSAFKSHRKENVNDDGNGFKRFELFIAECKRRGVRFLPRQVMHPIYKTAGL